MKRFQILNVLLLVLIALAIWRIADVWRRPAPVGDAGGVGRQLATNLPPVRRKPPIPKLVNTIAQKDLFDASRQEAAGEAVAAPEPTPAPPPPTLTLAGVIFVGMEPEAVLTDAAQGNKQIRLRVGEEVSGYRVDRISTENVTLVGGAGDEVSLPLRISTVKSARARFGPGGRPTPKAAKRKQDAKKKKQGREESSVDGKTDAERRREDARRRAERARERLKRLRAEAARNR